MADRKFSQFILIDSEDLLGTDFFAGYRSGLDNTRTTLDDLSTYIWNNFPLSFDNGSLIGFDLGGNLANIKIGSNLNIDGDGFLNATGGGGGGISSVTGTVDQIDATPGPDVVLSFANDPVLPGNATAASFNAQGIHSVAGPGTLTVTNGNPVINGDSTFFTRDLGVNSSIYIDGVGYTVSQVITDNTIILTANYAGSDASGLSYEFDAPFLAMTTSDGVHLGQITNSGELVYDAFMHGTYAPSIKPSSLGGTSSLILSADALFVKIASDSSGQIQFSAENNAIGSIDNVGNMMLAGSMSLGSLGSLTGSTLAMPVQTYDTYSPRIVSSTVSDRGRYTFNADEYVFNSASDEAFTFNGIAIFSTEILVGGDVVSNRTVAPSSVALSVDGSGYPQIQFGGSSNTLTFDGTTFLFSNPIQASIGTFTGSVSAFGSNLVMTDDGSGNPVINFFDSVQGIKFSQNLVFNGITAPSGIWDIVTFNSVGTATDGNFKAVQFLSFNGTSDWNVSPGVHYENGEFVARDGTIFFDIPNDGLLQFGDFVEVYLSIGVGSTPTGAYGIEIFNARATPTLYLQNMDDIPFTPTTPGIVFYSQFDEGLGHSIGFYKDEAGNVTQIGAGSGGGGTVTEVDVTSDLTVDGTPGGSFTVDGTIGLAPTGVTAAFYDFPALSIDANGRVTDGVSRGFYNSSSSVLLINGSGTTSHSGIAAGTIFGEFADASDDDIANFVALGNNAQAGNHGISIGSGAGFSTSGHNIHLFIGSGADATVNELLNIAAIGPNARVSRDNTYSYGDPATPVSHGFNTPAADSSLHVVSGSTSGALGAKGVARFNGIPTDPSNNWPVTDKVFQQNALITTGVSTNTILTIPISNALGGCITRARIQVSGIINNGTASGAGEISVVGAFDGTNTFYLNAVSSTTPVAIVLDPGTTAPFGLPAGTASAQVVLSGTSGPGAENILVQVIGINATTINWIAWCEYYTTQAISND